MEQHPIPQNVTTFQFRLIGDMTIKQFGYLALGAIIAYICYKLPLPIIISWPLAGLFALLGIGLAFVPIEERPMDVWILAFIKSIYSPTVYVWQKRSAKVEPGKNVTTAVSKQSPPQSSVTTKLRDAMMENSPLGSSQPDHLLTLPNAYKPEPQITSDTQSEKDSNTPRQEPGVSAKFTDPGTRSAEIINESIIENKKQSGFLNWLFKIFFGGKKQTPSKLASSAVKKAPTQDNPPVPKQQPTDNLNKPQETQVLPIPSVDSPPKDPEPNAAPPAPVSLPPGEQAPVPMQKERIEQELAAIHEREANEALEPTQPPKTPKLVATTETPTVRIITPEAAPKAGLPKLTTFPNVVTGIIKDGDGNLLPGVLVTVRDKNSMPLRALKSNKLGQIAASTPLPNDTYMIEVEDPRSRFVFDRAQITLNGSVMPPIEIIAKSQKEMLRAKLEKELFGNKM